MRVPTANLPQTACQRLRTAISNPSPQSFAYRFPRPALPILGLVASLVILLILLDSALGTRWNHGDRVVAGFFCFVTVPMLGWSVASVVRAMRARLPRAVVINPLQFVRIDWNELRAYPLESLMFYKISPKGSSFKARVVFDKDGEMFPLRNSAQTVALRQALDTFPVTFATLVGEGKKAALDELDLLKGVSDSGREAPPAARPRIPWARLRWAGAMLVAGLCLFWLLDAYNDSSADQSRWARARLVNTVRSYHDYLSVPGGRFRKEAEAGAAAKAASDAAQVQRRFDGAREQFLSDPWRRGQPGQEIMLALLDYAQRTGNRDVWIHGELDNALPATVPRMQRQGQGDLPRSHFNGDMAPTLTRLFNPSFNAAFPNTFNLRPGGKSAGASSSVPLISVRSVVTLGGNFFCADPFYVPQFALCNKLFPGIHYRWEMNVYVPERSQPFHFVTDWENRHAADVVVWVQSYQGIPMGMSGNEYYEAVKQKSVEEFAARAAEALALVKRLAPGQPKAKKSKGERRR